MAESQTTNRFPPLDPYTLTYVSFMLLWSITQYIAAQYFAGSWWKFGWLVGCFLLTVGLVIWRTSHPSTDLRQTASIPERNELSILYTAFFALGISVIGAESDGYLHSPIVPAALKALLVLAFAVSIPSCIYHTHSVLLCRIRYRRPTTSAR